MCTAIWCASYILWSKVQEMQNGAVAQTNSNDPFLSKLEIISWWAVTLKYRLQFCMPPKKLSSIDLSISIPNSFCFWQIVHTISPLEIYFEICVVPWHLHLLWHFFGIHHFQGWLRADSGCNWSQENIVLSNKCQSTSGFWWTWKFIQFSAMVWNHWNKQQT